MASDIGKPGTVWICAGFGIVAIVFFAVRVPETKDRSLEEIEQELGVDQGEQARAA